MHGSRHHCTRNTKNPIGENKSLRMTAPTIRRLCFPAANNRSAKTRRIGLKRTATMAGRVGQRHCPNAVDATEEFILLIFVLLVHRARKSSRNGS
jgi:hypothetical protein